jgi:hypothetical protein
MPLDPTHNSFYKLANWEHRFAWWPQRCAESGRLIWLTKAYYGVYDRSHWDGRHYYSWLNPDAYLICVLNGTI